MSVYNTTIYFMYHKIVYRQGDMFRPSMGHPQALKENGSKTTWNFFFCSLGSVFSEGLRMIQWRSKHVARTIYYFKVYEINCCVIDWHICVFYKYYFVSNKPPAQRDEEGLQKLFFNAHFTAPKHRLIYTAALRGLLVSFGKGTIRTPGISRTEERISQIKHKDNTCLTNIKNTLYIPRKMRFPQMCYVFWDKTLRQSVSIYPPVNYLPAKTASFPKRFGFSTIYLRKNISQNMAALRLVLEFHIPTFAYHIFKKKWQPRAKALST